MRILAIICFPILFITGVNSAAGQSVFPKNPTTETFAIPVVSETSGSAVPLPRIFRMAIRSNLLSDIILMPNIGVEIPIGKRYSVAADFIYTYWRINNRYAIQTIQGNLEGRYWFDWKDRELTGWNIGVYVTLSGDYDVQWQGGWQGDRFWSTGLTGGYSMQISPTFNLDFSLGAGLFFTPEARSYERPQDGHLIWKETRYDVTRFSLTKARVSLVWLFNITKKSNR